MAKDSERPAPTERPEDPAAGQGSPEAYGRRKGREEFFTEDLGDWPDKVVDHLIRDDTRIEIDGQVFTKADLVTGERLGPGPGQSLKDVAVGHPLEKNEQQEEDRTNQATIAKIETECLTVCQEAQNIVQIENKVRYDPILITRALYNLTESGQLETWREDGGYKMWKAA